MTVSSLHLLVPRPKEFWGGRQTLGLLGFLGFAGVYAMRVNLSVAIVAMVKSAPTNSSEYDACPLPDDYDPEDSGNEVSVHKLNQSTLALSVQILMMIFVVRREH